MSASEQPSRQDARVSTGVPGLDAVLGGGLVASGVYIVVGEPGAGKTLFANQLCYHQGRAGARCLYVTLLAESHARMLANMRDMAFFDSALLPEGVYYVSGFRMLEEQGLPGLLELLRREVRNHNASILVLDGLVQAREAAGSSRDFKKFIHELQVAASLARFTALLLTSANGPAVHPEYTMVDGEPAYQEVSLMGMSAVDVSSLRHLYPGMLFLQKPFDIAALMRQVRKALDAKRA